MSEYRGTLVTDHTSGEPVLRRVRVRVVEGPAEGVSLELPAGTTLVGSHSDAGLVLDDPRISRRHCELAPLDDGVRVRDLGSRNGTFHGRSRLESAVLAPGARVKLGDSVLLLEAVDQPAELDALASFGTLSTANESMARVFAMLRKTAATDTTVLLEGETGVGKDVLARQLHAHSKRRDGPFVVFDCGAVARELLASELFGHKKGAFTGATDSRAGVFEAAKGGTLFLDEIGELPLDLQPSLLRALENRQVRRVGESGARDVDVRVVAATNRALRDRVKDGTFREDLFFRLAVVRVRVPALRERREDLPALARTLLEELGHPATALRDEDVALLADYDWPGNVRELRNLLEQSAALAGDDGFRLLGPDADDDDLRAASADGDEDEDEDEDDLPYKEARGEALAAFEGRYVQRLLLAHDGNVSAAARAAGIDRNYVYRLMKRYGIEKTGEIP